MSVNVTLIKRDQQSALIYVGPTKDIKKGYERRQIVVQSELVSI